MKKIYTGIFLILILFFFAAPAHAKKPEATGPEECANVYHNRMFSGPAYCLTQKLGGQIGPGFTTSNDHLVATWNHVWEQGEQEGWIFGKSYEGAELHMQWNGMNPDGSYVTEHSKLIWVGPQAYNNNPLWQDGGFMVSQDCRRALKFNNFESPFCRFEAIFVQGIEEGSHYWSAPLFE